MIGGSGNPAQAGISCVSPDSTGYDNPAATTIWCISALGYSITGNITNEGTLSENGPHIPSILLSSTSLTGSIANSGTINTYVQITNGSTVTGSFTNSGTAGGIQVDAGSTLSGGIFNTSTGTLSENGPAISVVGSVSGGITNAGRISSTTGSGIIIDGTFFGGISNSGKILSENGPAIFLGGSVSGGITNAGRISSTSGSGILIDGTFSGGISNSGTISGTVGINDYTSNGVSIFNSGTITGTSGTAIWFGSGTNTLTLGAGYLINGSVLGSGNDTLQLGGTGNGTFDLSAIGNSQQQYQGFTTFNVIGGTWTVNNAYTQTDPWTVQGGTLLVNGDLSQASSLTVSGGVLGGTGIVGNTQINSGGTFAPGTPGAPGTSMTVSGNLAFQSGALYLAQVNSSSSTTANVTGTASLAGNVLAVVAPGSSVTRQYDILNSAGLTNTTFAAAGTNMPGFSASLSYTPTDVFLNLTGTLGSSGGLGANQQNVANRLNNFFNGGGALTPNFTSIFGLSGGNLTAGLSQLSGEVASDSQQGAFQIMNQFLGLMVDPFANGRGGGAGGGGGAAIGFAPEQTSSLPPEIALAYASVLKAPPAAPTDRRWSVWGQAYGGYDATNGNQALGTSDMTARVYGIASGFDYRVTPDTVVGFALAGGGTNWGLSQGLGSGRSDAFQAGIYGITRYGPAYISAALAAASYEMTTNRVALGDQLTANFNAQSYGGRLEGGYRYDMAGYGITPYAALQTQWFHTPNYQETDLTGGGFGLAYNSMTANDTRSELGTRFDHLQMVNGMPLLLSARVAWAHDWVSNSSLTATFETLPGTSFIVNGAGVPSDSALVGAGATLQLNKSLSVEAKFDDQFADTSQIYTGTGTLRYSW
jgi:outer membrane autotransporter protein